MISKMDYVPPLLKKLINAVIDNDVEEVNRLLNNGLNPNQSLDSARVTPLHFAAQNNSLEVIPLLIEAGADPQAETIPDGQTPLDVAILHENKKVAQALVAYINHTDETEH